MITNRSHKSLSKYLQIAPSPFKNSKKRCTYDVTCTRVTQEAEQCLQLLEFETNFNFGMFLKVQSRLTGFRNKYRGFSIITGFTYREYTVQYYTVYCVCTKGNDQ